jgi:two-component system, cell cycle response regulator DivK
VSSGGARGPVAERRSPSPGTALSYTILIIDAHEDSRLIYTAVLEHHSFRVLSAASIAEGVLLARGERPDLAFLAFPPAPGDPWPLVERFRAEGAAQAIPVVGLSTESAPQARDRALASGCNGYLTKPCGPLELLGEARRILAGSQ